MATHGSNIPGTWEIADLPELVGITHSTSRPLTAASMASSWPGRRLIQPKSDAAGTSKSEGWLP